MANEEQVVVVGGGVSGLTSGIALAEAGMPVRLVAADIPGRTSLAAGAMWGPYLVEPWEKVREWSLISLEVFRDLAGRSGTGVRMTGGVEAARSPMEVPSWSELLPDFRACESGDLPLGFVSGYRFTVPLVDMPVYLAYLRRRFLNSGGELEQRFVTTLSEFRGALAVVNCTGLGAGELASDASLYAIGGQHVVVENPGITEFFSEDTGASPDLLCIYPHGDVAVLGGTAVNGDAAAAGDPSVAEGIIERCAGIVPELAEARVLEHRAGTRPTRPEVRVEAVRERNNAVVVHNYGHGGAGVTLSWGCAGEVVRLVGESLSDD